jgi:hypothetical protein
MWVVLGVFLLVSFAVTALAGLSGWLEQRRADRLRDRFGHVHFPDDPVRP